jgi:hypothetical protein
MRFFATLPVLLSLIPWVLAQPSRTEMEHVEDDRSVVRRHGDRRHHDHKLRDRGVVASGVPVPSASARSQRVSVPLIFERIAIRPEGQSWEGGSNQYT